VWDFTETTPFGAGCVGLAALGISYIAAGVDRCLLVVLPLLAILIYYLVFRD